MASFAQPGGYEQAAVDDLLDRVRVTLQERGRAGELRVVDAFS